MAPYMVEGSSIMGFLHSSVQVRITFPDWPDRMASNPFSKSWNG